MDRRQIKTQNAIFDAFITLISKENYSKISIQEIIDEANIGRSTFYTHYKDKDELLDALCKEIFDHILTAAKDLHHTHGVVEHDGVPNSVICHMLQHIKENDHNILILFSCESNDIFLKYFKEHLRELMRINFIQDRPKREIEIPEDFLLNHITGSFVEMVQWWIKNGLKETPEQLDFYFSTVIIKGC